MKNGPEYGDNTKGALSKLLQTIDQPEEQQNFAPPQVQQPYLRLDYDGKSMFVSSLLENQEKAKLLIDAMTAMVPFLPKEKENEEEKE
jgi:hypothetical protein